MKQENHLRVKGTVLARDNAGYRIKIGRPVECEGCGNCVEGAEDTVLLPSDRELHEGDTVWLTISCSSLAGISFFLYMLPAVFAVIGFSLGYYFAGNPGGLLGALLFLAAGYTAIKLFFSRKFSHTIGIEEAG